MQGEVRLTVVDGIAELLLDRAAKHNAKTRGRNDCVRTLLRCRNRVRNSIAEA